VKVKKTFELQFANSAKHWNLYIKTSSPESRHSKVQMSECVTCSRKCSSWQQVLSYK